MTFLNVKFGNLNTAVVRVAVVLVFSHAEQPFGLGLSERETDQSNCRLPSVFQESQQFSDQIRPCLVDKKFSTVLITSNLRIHVWNIKYN